MCPPPLARCYFPVTTRYRLSCDDGDVDAISGKSKEHQREPLPFRSRTTRRFWRQRSPLSCARAQVGSHLRLPILEKIQPGQVHLLRPELERVPPLCSELLRHCALWHRPTQTILVSLCTTPFPCRGPLFLTSVREEENDFSHSARDPRAILFPSARRSQSQRNQPVLRASLSPHRARISSIAPDAVSWKCPRQSERYSEGTCVA